ITKEEPAFRVDIIVNVHGQTLKASNTGSKLFPVIDGSAKKMIRQLKKLRDRRRKPRVISEPKIEA
ncbi:MAG: HPF/RaiA family ribosome-associated protein, partial [Gemmatimonadota bacterium]|nr:HPF/RaiA family ribosome-associated protein [Gemmatimonadota bacterium]